MMAMLDDARQSWGKNGGGYKERGGRIADETGDGYWFQPEPRHAHDARCWRCSVSDMHLINSGSFFVK